MGFRNPFLQSNPNVAQLMQSRPDLFSPDQLAIMEAEQATRPPAPPQQTQWDVMQEHLGVLVDPIAEMLATSPSSRLANQPAPPPTVDPSRAISPAARAEQASVPGQPVQGPAATIPDALGANEFVPAGGAGEADANVPGTETARPAIPNLPLPTESKGLKEARDRLGKAVVEEAQAEATGQILVSEQLDRYQKELDTLNEGTRKQQNAVLNNIREYEASIDDESRRLADAKIDSNRFWKNAGTGKTILGALSIGLGALGAALTGRQGNSALKIIENAIDRDIAAQREDLATRKSALVARDTLLQRMYQRYGEMDKAATATKVALLDRTKNEIERIAALTKSDTVLANANKMLAEIDLKREEALAAARGKITEQSLKELATLQKNNFDREQTLAKAFQSNEPIKQLLMTNEAMTRINTASEDAAGDLSLIFAYMKMLDPGSVVREGEFANAQNAAGVPARVANIYNRLVSGERLTPEQRAAFKGQAKTTFASQVKKAQPIITQYRQRAIELGIDPKNVVILPEIEGQVRRVKSDPLAGR